MIEIDFKYELKQHLPDSSMSLRKNYAQKIVLENIDIKDLFEEFLNHDNSVLSRFLWLLSDIGEVAPGRLLELLPILLANFDKIKIPNIASTFANYWLIAGVPQQDESKVINLLFTWVDSHQTNITTKSRSIYVLENLAGKYPDLRNELKLHLESLIGKYSKDFDKKIKRVLGKIS